MHVAIVFPPLCDPRAPQLALPSLAAFLRNAGVQVSLHDLNIAGIVDLFDPDRMRQTHAMLAHRARREATSELARAMAVCERLIALADLTPSDLRDRAHFFDPMRHADARRTLDEVLRTASLASGFVDARLAPIQYNVQELDPASLRDLIVGTADGSPHLFASATDRLLAELAAAAPTLVGVTITNRQQIFPALALARRLRAEGHFTVIGGALISKFREQLCGLPDFFRVFADAVVVFEGETALLALATAVTEGTPLAEVPNLLFPCNGAVTATAPHVENVAALPTPDFRGLPLEGYFAPDLVLPILTGKGCYFNRCKFCDIPFINHISRKPYRVRPVERVVDDVHTLGERHGVSSFVITDEALSPRLLCELADAFAHRPGDFSFTGYARPEPGFTGEACRKIAALGMHKLFFGLESGSQETLDHMDKGVNLAQVPVVLRNCREAGIDFHLFGIIGLPEESRGAAEATPRFMAENANVIDSPGSSFDLHPFGLELRTRYFEDRVAHGLTVNEKALSREFVIGLEDQDWANTAGLSGAEVRRLIGTEFLPMLKRVFKTWHASADPVWPPQEEYAVLYRRYYEGAPFPWRTCLPEDDAPFTFVPSRLCAAAPGSSMTIDRLDYAVPLPHGLARMIGSGETLPWRAHLARWSDAPNETDARESIEALIELGLVLVRSGPDHRGGASVQ
jgi:radical SAM superfamily enzyme YgiQ (UPF0313 family)